MAIIGGARAVTFVHRDMRKLPLADIQTKNMRVREREKEVTSW